MHIWSSLLGENCLVASNNLGLSFPLVSTHLHRLHIEPASQKTGAWLCLYIKHSTEVITQSTVDNLQPHVLGVQGEGEQDVGAGAGVKRSHK